MRLPFFSRKFVTSLRTGAGENLEHYKGHEVSWLERVTPGQPYLLESASIVDPPPRLLEPEGDLASSEAENAIRMHKWLKGISPATAMEERLWACMAHVTFCDYMRLRWPVASQGEVLRRYLFEGSSFGALARHGIARLWWAAHLTFDPARADPYELTRVMFMRQDVQLALMDRAIGKCRTVRTAILEFLQDNADWFGNKAFGRRIQLIIRDLNLLGGVVILDALPESQLKQFIDLIGRRIAGRESGAQVGATDLGS